MIAVEWSVMCAIYDNIGILTTAAKLAPTHLILLEVLFAKSWTVMLRTAPEGLESR
jgi:hypothetical protein